MAQFFEITDSGIVFKDFQTIRAELKEAFHATFGVEMDDSPTSPDGHHIDLEAKTVYSVFEAIQAVATMLDRKQASGVFLDYLASFLNIVRNDGETDDQLRKRMDSASVDGVSTNDGMLTYLRDHIDGGVEMDENPEPTATADGMPPHSVRVSIPFGYERPSYESESPETKAAELANFIAKQIWACKGAGIKTCGNASGYATGRDGKRHEVGFVYPENVSVDVKISLSLYSEEEFPEDGTAAVEEAVRAWAAKALKPGKDVIPERFYTPIMTVPGIESATFLLKKSSASEWQTGSIPIGVAEMATLDGVEVTVAE